MNKIWVYTIAYNEEHFVPYFLYAYRDAEKIIVYNNQSTDKTCRLLRKDPRVEIRTYKSGNQIRDDKYIEIKDNCWKEARGIADWVIIVDFDELFTKAVYPDNFSLNFKGLENFDLIVPFGYNIFIERIPDKKNPFYKGIKALYHSHSEKPCCFRPDKLAEINYLPGCHFAKPVFFEGHDDERILHHENFKLLHYKHTNIDVYLKKNAEYGKRLSKYNLGSGFGNHYLWPMEKHFNIYMQGLLKSVPLFFVQKTDNLDNLI